MSMKAAFAICGAVGFGIALLGGAPLAPALGIGLAFGAIGALIAATPVAAPVYHVVGAPQPVLHVGGWWNNPWHIFHKPHVHVTQVAHVAPVPQAHIIHGGPAVVSQPHILHGAPAVVSQQPHVVHTAPAMVPNPVVVPAPAPQAANTGKGFFNLFHGGTQGSHSTVQRTAPGSAPSVVTTTKDTIRGGTVHTSAPVIPASAHNVSSTRVMNPAAAPSATVAHTARVAPSQSATAHGAVRTTVMLPKAGR